VDPPQARVSLNILSARVREHDVAISAIPLIQQIEPLLLAVFVPPDPAAPAATKSPELDGFPVSLKLFGAIVEDSSGRLLSSGCLVPQALSVC